MKRIFPALLAGGLLLVTAAAHAAEGPAGTWRLSAPGSNLNVLLKFEEKGGKWSGQFVGPTVEGGKPPTVEDLAVTENSIRFIVRIDRRDFSFDGKLPAEKNGRIQGTLIGLLSGNRMLVAQLDPSKLKSFDEYEFNKEILEQSTDPMTTLDVALDLVKQAGEKKAKVEEVRPWADKVFRLADAYGSRWQRYAALKLAQALVAQKDFIPVAVEYARKTERLLDRDADDVAVQMELLDNVAQVLTKAGKADEAKKLEGELAKLEERDFAESAKKRPFKADPFEGRKGKSERAVLVELFTGAECGPCVAPEVAFEALEKTYKPTEVVLVEYHVHLSGLDPLTTAENMSRLQSFLPQLQQTKSNLSAPVFVNGKIVAIGGGGVPAARKAYAEYREAIEPALEKDPGGKIQLTATRKDKDIAIKASVSDLAKTGENVRLRFLLVEDHVRYAGGNGLRYHHCVVRSMPGGVKGFALAKKSAEQSVTVNLDDLRLKINDYLDDLAKNQGEFPKPDRPLAFKDLRVVALVQDDDSNDVLQSVQVDVK
ncbi:MAG TPA: hypothetical protein VGZ47_01435 [Gemmataceae bacterium]|jgi:hypothetical protein|nr:hypothetical protein [Gemmataceae bacterium]